MKMTKEGKRQDQGNGALPAAPKAHLRDGKWTYRQSDLSKVTRIFKAAGQRWQQACDKWVAEHGDPGRPRSSGGISLNVVYRFKRKMFSHTQFVLLAEQCCKGNDRTWRETAPDVIAFLNERGFKDCEYDVGYCDLDKDGHYVFWDEDRASSPSGTVASNKTEVVDTTTAESASVPMPVTVAVDAANNTVVTPNEGPSLPMPASEPITDTTKSWIKYAVASQSSSAENLLSTTSTPVPTTVVTVPPTTAVSDSAKASPRPRSPSSGKAESAEKVSVSALSAFPPYPPDSLIGRFVAYGETQVETPKPFLVAIALKLIEILLGRRVYFPWGTSQKIYSNTYHAMVGPSGQTRRSQGIDLGESMLNDIAPGHLLATMTSAEKLMDSFQEQNVRGLIASEGKSVIDMLNRSQELATLFLKLYDCQPVSTEFKKDRRKVEDDNGEVTKTCRIEVPDPFLSIGLGIAPEVWRLTDSNQENGVMGRFLMQYAARRGRDILAAPPARPDVRDQLVTDLARLREFSGAMTLSPAAERLFQEINTESHSRLDEDMPPAIGSFLARLPFTMLRVAMSFQAATSQSLVIGSDTLRCAQRHVEDCFENYKFFFMEMRKDKLIRCADRSLRTLQKHGPQLPHSSLFSRVSSHGEYTEKEFKAALRHLHCLGKVTVIDNKKTHFPDVLLVPAGAAEPSQIDVKAQGGVGPSEITTAATTTATSDVPEAAPADVTRESAAHPDFGTTILTSNAKILQQVVAAVAFAANPRDYRRIFSNIALYFNEDGLYIAASDNHSVALVRFPPKGASCAQDDRRIIVNCAAFKAVLKAVKPGGQFVLEADNDYLTVLCTDQWGMTITTVRIAMAPADIRAVYPNIPASPKCQKFGTRIAGVDKRKLVDTLETILPTSEIALITADAGKEFFEIGIPEQHAVAVRCAAIQTGLSKRIALSTQSVLDILKRIHGEKITLSFTTDERRAAIQSENPNYFYMMLRRKDPKTND